MDVKEKRYEEMEEESNLPQINKRVITSETISLKQATFMMASTSFGSAVLTLPYTVQQLGPIPWLLLTFIIHLIMLYTSNLLKLCCQVFYEGKTDSKQYPALFISMAEEYTNPLLTRVFAVVLQFTYASMGLAFFPLSATVISGLFPVPDLSNANQIRLWCFILLLLVSPLMYLGFYKDFKTTAYFAFISSSISLVIVIVLSLVLKYQHTVEDNISFFHDIRPSNENFFVTFGTISFSVVGPALILCNISTFARRREKLGISLLWTYIFLFCVYIIAAMIPYYVFGKYIHPSVVNTFGLYAGDLHPFLRVGIIICKVAIVTHMLLTSVMLCNPLFLNFEMYLNIPIEFSWKRFLLRTCGILIILAISCIIPNFQPIVSIVGAVPAVMVSVVFPIILYAHMFELSIIEKSLVLVLVIFATIFMIGNFVFSVKKVVHLLSG